MQFGLYSLFQTVKDTFQAKRNIGQYPNTSLYNKYQDYQYKSQNSSMYKTLNNKLMPNDYNNAGYNLMNFDSKKFLFGQYAKSGNLTMENEKNNMLRMVRVNEYDMMEEMAEIASTLDIVAEESVQPDEYGDILTIRSPYKDVVSHVEGLLFGTLDMENNSYSIMRNMNKYGDEFNEIVFNNDYSGIVGLVPAKVKDVECIINTNQNMDLQEPILYRHKGSNDVFTNKEMLHFKLTGDSRFDPYGHSILEKARRVWRQINLLEDAIMIHFLVRTPMRRVFEFDVTGVPKNLHFQYMQRAKSIMMQNNVVDQSTGNIDKRNISLDMMQDFYIPMINGNALAKITNIEGDTKDIGQISGFSIYQSKLFSALQVPKPYLNYDDDTGNKSLLAQEDVKFSRKISRGHTCFLYGLYKAIYIDMILSGKFTDEQIKSVEINMTNPSTISQTLKIDLMTKKIDIAKSLKDTEMISQKYIMKNIFEFSDEEIKNIYVQRSIENKWKQLIDKGMFHDKLKNPDEILNVDEYGLNNVDMSGDSKISGKSSGNEGTNQDTKNNNTSKSTSKDTSSKDLNANNSAQHISQLIQPAQTPNLKNVATTNPANDILNPSSGIGGAPLFTSHTNYHKLNILTREYIFEKINKVNTKNNDKEENKNDKNKNKFKIWLKEHQEKKFEKEKNDKK